MKYKFTAAFSVVAAGAYFCALTAADAHEVWEAWAFVALGAWVSFIAWLVYCAEVEECS